MNGKNRRILSILLAASSCTTALFVPFFAVGCGYFPNSSSSSDKPIESVDNARTQLFVFNTDFGVDSGWLMQAKTRFESAHASDTCWEQGKTGVQVVIRNTSRTAQEEVDEILENREEVYFTQQTDYRNLLKKGLLANLTETVTGPLLGESRSIEQKLTETQREYFGITEAETDGMANGSEQTAKYYALPYAYSHFGIVYNVELFDKMGYYFAAEPQENGSPFISTENKKKSLGADGKENTADDGLPTTYSEFFTLCDYILENDQTPLTFGGENYEEYLTWLTDALAAEENGYAQTVLQYTLDGVATNLGSIRDAKFKQDETDLTITEENGYELARSAGNYYALEFTKKLTGQTKYHDQSAFKRYRSQAQARKDFIWRSADGETSDIAMLLDGSWWESGATEAFSQLTEKIGERGGKMHRQFVWMPLPTATAQTEKESVLVDCLGSMAFIKSNVAEWKKPLAEEFLRFIYSDEELRAYTRETGTLSALDYTLQASDVGKLSLFGRSLLAAREDGKTVYPYSTAKTYVKNERFFEVTQKWRASFVFAAAEQYPIDAFKNRNLSVVDYFNGMFKYRRETWETLEK